MSKNINLALLTIISATSFSTIATDFINEDFEDGNISPPLEVGGGDPNNANRISVITSATPSNASNLAAKVEGPDSVTGEQVRFKFTIGTQDVTNKTLSFNYRTEGMAQGGKFTVRANGDDLGFEDLETIIVPSGGYDWNDNMSVSVNLDQVFGVYDGSTVKEIEVQIRNKSDNQTDAIIIDDILYTGTFNQEIDTDGDGYVDSEDDSPNDANVWTDTDSDGIDDSVDTDDDGDGVIDTLDPDPLDANLTTDVDNDGFDDSVDDFIGAGDITNLTILAEYFDISIDDAVSGAVLTGRINLQENRRLYADNNHFSDNFYFAFASDQASGTQGQNDVFSGQNDYYNFFELEKYEDDKGRVFGKIKLASGNLSNLQAGTYKLRVELRSPQSGNNPDLIKARATATVVVHGSGEKTTMEKFRDEIRLEVDGVSRVNGDKEYTASDITNLQTELNNGVVGQFDTTNTAYFSRSDVYTAKPTLVDTTSDKDYIEIVDRIAGMAFYYYENNLQDATLRKDIYRAIIEFVKASNVNDLHDDLSNGITQTFADMTDQYTSAKLTHQWNFTDPLAGAAVFIAEDFIADIDNGVTEAVEAHDALHHFLNIAAFDIPLEWRVSSRLRYYMEDFLSESPGALGDANRGHRLRTWALLPVIWNDYNRPLTELPWWYSDYEGTKNTDGTSILVDVDGDGVTDTLKNFVTEGTSILPGWEPKGAFSDLQFWINTVHKFTFRYSQSGLNPDGTISHHVGHRADLAGYGYGFDWLFEHFHYGKDLKDTPWPIDNSVFNVSSDFTRDFYSSVLYQGGLDYQAAGRSFYSHKMGDFAKSEVVGNGINSLLDAKGSENKFKGYGDLKQLRFDLNTSLHKVDNNPNAAYNRAYWVNDFLIHRSDDTNPYYMSVKMQSDRTRGAESFGTDPGYHNGNGVLQVKTYGDEYDLSRYSWDWHTLSGTTSALRGDLIPTQSSLEAFNENHFSGVLSNGEIGLASFHHELTDHLGSTTYPNGYGLVKARKSYFFLDDKVIAIGNGIDSKTGGSIAYPIVTTIEQAAQKVAVRFGDGTSNDESLSSSNNTFNSSAPNNNDYVFSVSDDVWFHHGNTGYIVFTDSSIDIRYSEDGGINSSEDIGNASAHEDVSTGDIPDPFRIAIQHSDANEDVSSGATPDGASYVYAVIPYAVNESDSNSTKKNTMNSLMSSLQNTNNLQVVNTVEKQGLIYNDSGSTIIQMAFHEVGSGTANQSFTFNGTTYTVGVDKPSLVQLVEQNGQWNITVQDPTHHIDVNALPSHSERFRVELKNEVNQISVTFSEELKEDTYYYEVKSPDYLTLLDGKTAAQLGQKAEVTYDGSTGISTIIFDLPDGYDDDYGKREEFYAGMPATVVIDSAP
ncbi:polysaccharide lyase family 8 super-sandwich domain-containing protein [Thalassotalea sp. SU-HH00458]|uniref:polysaccharide lyase family 8 super-sandwich domain-containing protein n=1 Tax=Thalassotalea sp. SU-HH00458 TaxID=3127657 RepID=UPI00310C2EB0